MDFGIDHQEPLLRRTIPRHRNRVMVVVDQWDTVRYGESCNTDRPNGCFGINKNNRGLTSPVLLCTQNPLSTLVWQLL